MKIFNREEKIRLTVSELRRELGESLNGHLENVLRTMVAAANIELRTVRDETKRWSILKVWEDFISRIRVVLDLSCLVFLALVRSQTNNNIIGFLPRYCFFEDLQRGSVKKVAWYWSSKRIFFSISGMLRRGFLEVYLSRNCCRRDLHGLAMALSWKLKLAWSSIKVEKYFVIREYAV